MALSIAFKEWAVICRSLAEDRQAVILRKGGIAEAGGTFRPDHDRFLLYPTYFHERHRTGLKPELLPLHDAAEAEKPPPGVVRFEHVAEVAAVGHVADYGQLAALDSLHGWTAEEVQKRFDYRTPGLYVLVLRVFRLPRPVEVIERPEYAGCKTWVELDPPIATDGATPVTTQEKVETAMRVVKSLGGVSADRRE
jgi:hypothetical protein